MSPALTKVYVWTGAPTPGSPVVSGALTSLFERLLPPALSTLPSSTHTVLAENPVTTDTHCAFACYRWVSWHSPALHWPFKKMCGISELCSLTTSALLILLVFVLDSTRNVTKYSLPPPPTPLASLFFKLNHKVK